MAKRAAAADRGGDVASRHSRHGTGERRGQAGDDAVPVADARLPEQPRAWVPRAVLAREQPAPILDVRQQNPDRLAEGASKMRHRGVDGDHQIELRDDGRGVGKVGEAIVHPQDAGPIGRMRSTRSAGAYR